MEAKAFPTYAPVGEATMDKASLPTGFTWKRGFFTNQSKGQHYQQVLAQNMAKRNSEKQCLLVEKTQNQYQQTILTSEAIPSDIYHAMTPDPSPLTLHVITVTTPCIELDARPTSQHNSSAQTTTKAGMALHVTSKHDDDHIHCASPIQGLPPENKLHIGQHQANHNNNSTQPQNQEKRKNTTKARLTPQNHQNQHNPIKIGNTTQRDYRAALIDPLAPPPPLDANKGPEAVMKAIDAWFEYQDSIKSAQKTTTHHLPNAEERNTAVLRYLWTSSQMQPLNKVNPKN